MLFKLGKPLVMVCVGEDFLLPTWLLFPSETTASYCATFFYIFHFLARFFFLSLIFRVDRAIKVLLLLLRLFVWRVLASHLAAPTHRGRSPPPPPPVNHPHTHTHTYLLTDSTLPHVICFCVCLGVSPFRFGIFIIIIFRVILCFALQFLWKNSTFTFFFRFLFSFICLLHLFLLCPRLVVCVC